ncbi:hypothetical protein PMZ80_002605 [Knufia obscura]|uniref:6-methylsalicylate decarboxylase n=2 Tax=Knufia TaxID=430999 RepID=A0AAN8ED65_9EURO|nr:hypothetical protein PMZ80_002605 [Knufia obscura]KAK5951385.1 hypothetical protein OHC33_007441 [Knufia fluminis]
MPLQKLDLHSHFVPDFYRDALLKAGYQHPDGMPAIPQWSEKDHLDFHTSLNVTKSILSITSPGTHLIPGQDAQARTLTRRVNEYASDLKRRRPSQFGFFASLPLPDVEGSLAEIAYASDTLNADGFTLMTNHHGLYPGDKNFDPVFDELNRRKAIVFIHPTTPCTAHHDGSAAHAAPLEHTYPRPMFEFFFDTARAYIHLFLSGTISRCPDITFVVTHAAGALPPLITRFATAPALLKLPGIDLSVTPEYVKERLNSEQFFFDTAGWVFPDQIRGLLAYLKDSEKGKRIVYGSDYPWTPFAGVKALSEAHDTHLSSFFPGEEESVAEGNAKRLLGAKGRQGKI